MLEAIAADSSSLPKTGKSALSRGYGDSYILDLMVDYRLGADRPFAWISYNFHKTYPAIIWGLRLLMADELFDVPQAGLTAVPLHEAFSWAYAHFILEDQESVPQVERPAERRSLTRQVLGYDAATA